MSDSRDKQRSIIVLFSRKRISLLKVKSRRVKQGNRVHIAIRRVETKKRNACTQGRQASGRKCGVR